LILGAFLLVNATICHLSLVLALVVQGDAVNCKISPGKISEAPAHKTTRINIGMQIEIGSDQGRPYVDATDVGCIGPRSSGGPAPWWLGSVNILPDTPCAQEL